MKLMKSIACVLLLFLSAAILSTARLMPAGAEVNGSSAIKASTATSTINKTMVKTLAGVEENLKKFKVGNDNNKPASRVQGNRRVRSSHLYGEVDKGLMTFAADYHPPKHHPPKNN